MITAQTIALTNETTAVLIRGRRMSAAVLLIEALGGGWHIADLPSATETTERYGLPCSLFKAGGSRHRRRCEQEPHAAVQSFFTHNPLNAPVGSKRSAVQRKPAGMNLRAACGRSSVLLCHRRCSERTLQIAKETTMQSPYLPTHRLRFSPPRPAASGLPATNHQDTVYELFSYMSVLPEQFYGPQTSIASGRPEAELMRAVLEDALLCFQKGLVRQGRRVQRLAREAEEWLFSDDSRWPFSFVSICAVLGLEPEYIRRGLKRRGSSNIACLTLPR